MENLKTNIRIILTETWENIPANQFLLVNVLCFDEDPMLVEIIDPPLGIVRIPKNLVGWHRKDAHRVANSIAESN